MKNNKRKLENKIENHNFVYIGTRFCFWLLVAFWTFGVFYLPVGYFDYYIDNYQTIYIFLFTASIISTFVFSIVHLVKIKNKKAFAIASLVISSIGLFEFLLGFLAGTGAS